MLAGDVPQRLVDAGERRHQDGAAPKERRAVDVLPVVLDPERILADQVVADLLHGRHAGASLTLEGRFPPTDEPVVGRDLDEPGPRPRVELFDLRDLHHALSQTGTGPRN